MGELLIEKYGILSIGEKIKRLRIYKGIKLKDISDEKLSISKISYIENNKVKPDKYSLEILANKLGTTYEYLSKDIMTQIQENIDLLNNDKSINTLKYYKYNLGFAIKYNFLNLVFDICHNILKKFVFEEFCVNNKEDFLEIILIYFRCIREIKDINKNNIYYLDLAMYFLRIGEYRFSSYYFNFLRVKCLKYGRLKEFEEFILINEIRCYIKLKEYSKIYTLRDRIDFYIKYSRNSTYRREFKYFNILLVVMYKIKEFNKEFILDSFREFDVEDRINYLYKVYNVLGEFGCVGEQLVICKELCSIIKNNNRNIPLIKNCEVFNVCTLKIYS